MRIGASVEPSIRVSRDIRRTNRVAEDWARRPCCNWCEGPLSGSTSGRGRLWHKENYPSSRRPQSPGGTPFGRLRSCRLSPASRSRSTLSYRSQSLRSQSLRSIPSAFRRLLDPRQNSLADPVHRGLTSSRSGLWTRHRHRRPVHPACHHAGAAGHPGSRDRN